MSGFCEFCFNYSRNPCSEFKPKDQRGEIERCGFLWNAEKRVFALSSARLDRPSDWRLAELERENIELKLQVRGKR
jgi:hypothetical protein